MTKLPEAFEPEVRDAPTSGSRAYSSAKCTVAVRFVPLPKEERVGRLARALAILLDVEEARDEQAAGH